MSRWRYSLVNRQRAKIPGMTKEQKYAFKIAENGVLGRVYEMRKALDMIEAWVLYGRMEKSGEGKCAVITEEQYVLDDDMVTRHPITGDEL